jgi:hypothetical protein
MADTRANAKVSGIPEHMLDAVAGYVDNHYPVGSFLQAVISNDLYRAVRMADDLNRDRLVNYVSFFYNHAPATCWGSPEAYASWVGGMAS